MIIVRIIGGLGNQLFQYALGQSLALKNNTELRLDISEFKTYKRHQYCLSYFNIKDSVATKGDVLKLRLLSYFSFLNLRYKATFVQESSSFDPKIINLPDNTYLSGYWQSEKYFKEIENIIKQDITLKTPASPEYNSLRTKINNINSVSLHIRRTDYFTIGLKVFEPISIDYYQRAVAEISRQTGALELFVFSDDIEWVKQNLKISFPTTFVSGNNLKNYEELMLMSACKHNITANSTFSWWGAWLNSNPKKIVITPRRWFIDPSREKDVIPEFWIRI